MRPFTTRCMLQLCVPILVMLLGVTGCLPKLDPGPAPLRVRLNPAMPGSMAAKPSRKQLTVAMPSAASEIDNDRIALVFNGREVRYLSGMRWAGNLPPMIQANLIDALESTNAFAGVGDETVGLASRAKLLGDIKQFALEYPSETAAPVAEFSATFRVLALDDAKIIATRQFAIRVPASGGDNAALLDALEKALEQGLAEISAWVVQSMK